MKNAESLAELIHERGAKGSSIQSHTTSKRTCFATLSNAKGQVVGLMTTGAAFVLLGTSPNKLAVLYSIEHTRGVHVFSGGVESTDIRMTLPDYSTSSLSPRLKKFQVSVVAKRDSPFDIAPTWAYSDELVFGDKCSPRVEPMHRRGVLAGFGYGLIH